jgi:uncharacterized tellurite resistance protein B-like protein
MTLSEIYTSGIQKQNRGHFANIVKIAKADEKVTIEEQALLFKIAKNLNLSPTNYSKILENPYKFPINPPVNSEDRITRLYGLATMVLADGSVALEEMKLMQKIAIGLGFSSKNVEKVCKKSIELIIMEVDLEFFIEEIKKVNRSKS